MSRSSLQSGNIWSSPQISYRFFQGNAPGDYYEYSVLENDYVLRADVSDDFNPSKLSDSRFGELSINQQAIVNSLLDVAANAYRVSFSDIANVSFSSTSGVGDIWLGAADLKKQ